MTSAMRFKSGWKLYSALLVIAVVPFVAAVVAVGAPAAEEGSPTAADEVRTDLVPVERAQTPLGTEYAVETYRDGDGAVCQEVRFASGVKSRGCAAVPPKNSETMLLLSGDGGDEAIVHGLVGPAVGAIEVRSLNGQGDAHAVRNEGGVTHVAIPAPPNQPGGPPLAIPPHIHPPGTPSHSHDGVPAPRPEPVEVVSFDHNGDVIGKELVGTKQ